MVVSVPALPSNVDASVMVTLGGRCTYVIPLEQAPIRPSVGSALAKTVVVELLPTAREIAKAPTASAAPLLKALPVHPAVVKRPTGTPGAVAPLKVGVLLLAGLVGVTLVSVVGTSAQVAGRGSVRLSAACSSAR